MPVRNYYRKRVSPWPRRLLVAALALVMVYAASQLIGYGMQMQQERALRGELSALLTESEQPHAPEEAAVQDASEPQQGSEDAAAPESGSTAQLRTSVNASAAVPKPAGKPEILMTYHALWERNNDLVGWLNVRALPQLDLPVVQRDQTYYLRRDFDGRSNMNGTAFMDVISSIWPMSDNMIIYAHNMKSGEMFGGLHKLMYEPFYRQSPLASFNTIYERANYVPVAVVLCSIHRGDDFFNFYVSDFKDEAAFDAYIARARELSSVHPPYDVAYGDQLLTLVTCYDEAHTKRLLVILRRVRENENPGELAAMWT